MTSYREAVAYFVRNSDLLEDFVLKYLSLRQKFSLFKFLEHHLHSFTYLGDECECKETVGGDANVQNTSLNTLFTKAWIRGTRETMHTQSTGSLSVFSVSSNEKQKEQEMLKKMLSEPSINPGILGIMEDCLSMGLFVNPDDLVNEKSVTRSQFSNSPREIVPKNIAISRQKKIKQESELTEVHPAFFGLSTEEDEGAHLQGYLMEEIVHFSNFTGGKNVSQIMHEVVRIGEEKHSSGEEYKFSQTEDENDNRRNLSAQNATSGPFASSFPVLKKQRFDAFVKSLDWRNTIHIVCQAIKNNSFTRNEIVKETAKNIIEFVGIDSIHLHLKDKNRMLLFRTDSSKKISYPFPTEELSVLQCTPTMAAFRREEVIIANNVFEDKRFQKEFFKFENKVQHVVDYPFFALDGSVTGVIQLQRKKGRESFNEGSLKLLHAFIRHMQLAFALREQMVAEHSRAIYNLFIKKIVSVMFSQIKYLDRVMKTIMSCAKMLIQAERCTLFLVDKVKGELVSTIMDRGDLKTILMETVDQIRIPLEQGIAGNVARNGLPMIVNDPSTDKNFFQGVDKSSGFKTINTIAVPIIIEDEVQGVLQLLNKSKGDFTKKDLEYMMEFAVFCGLSLHIANIYEKMYRSEQKCRVTMEIMLHHNIATDSDVEQYSHHRIPEFIEEMDEPLYSPWRMPKDDMPAAVIYMVNDLIGKSMVELFSLIRFTLTVRKNYRDVTYHNWYHGFSVTHATYVTLKRHECRFTRLEKFCLLVASLCHDLDHRGKDNNFLKKSHSALASLYTSSPLEHHHFNMTVTILQQPGNQIFAAFQDTPYYEILMIIKHAIISTDLSGFGKSKERFDALLTRPEGIRWQDQEDRMAVIGILLPSSDLCAMYKKWPVHMKVVLIVMEEMWSQGDEEKQSGMTPIHLMDRDMSYCLPDDQAGFLTAICLPCFKRLVQAVPSLNIITEQANKNLEQWMEIGKLPIEEKKRAVNKILTKMPQNALKRTFTPVPMKKR